MNITDAELPLPGDVFAGVTGKRSKTVIASVWGNDIIENGPIFGTVIFLRREPPYYEVGQIEFAPGIGWWQVADARTHMNINFAIEDFADSGGDV